MVIKMIIREHYIEKIREFYDSDLIKIITGIRRCGKSVILEEIRDEIAKKSDNIIYLNFEDEILSSSICNCDGLLKYVDEHKKSGKAYLFFDEIQEIDNWQKACKTLRLHNNSVFISGSNSKILSREFTREFSGRYVSFRVRPFVYKEILEYSKELGIEASIMDYLIWGGFPKRFEFNTDDARNRYLSDLNNTIIYNDLINRYNIKNENLFKRMVDYVLKSNGRVFSTRSIETYLKGEKISGSINTIISYLDHLEEAFIIDKIAPFNTKTKEDLKYYFKLYDADVSLNSIRQLSGRFDLTHNLENIVYNELLYMDYEVKVFNNDDKGIDFLAIKNNKKYYIQVAYTIVEEKNYEREFRVFNNLDNDSKKIIITNDDFDYSTANVKHIKLKDFLLMDNLDNI